ncbi:MAG: hypothetical protein M0Q90_05675 [Bacteroidales bacterium]|nr:hypothetical protein [Bacteroidales bacterium]
MLFRVNYQTISDIDLFSINEKATSLFSFYNRTKTPGGKELLYKIIKTPISDLEFLENRKAEIRYFQGLNCLLILDKRQFDFVEYYLRNRHIPLKNNIIDAAFDKLVNKLKSSNDYYVIREGVYHLCCILKALYEFLDNIKKTNPPQTLKEELKTVEIFLANKAIIRAIEKLPAESGKLKQRQINQLDNLFRAEKNTELISMLNIIYKIDVHQSHCELLQKEHFCLPEYSQTKSPDFEVVDCIHPFLPLPVPNSFKLDHKKSTVILTGPNMSGKSTFLKTVGILTYFAHLGIPVPAKKLIIPVLNGLFTTINLSDSLSQGFSHFYAEVNRIKEMAVDIQENSNLVVILDELFRGTNVKDAYDGTLMIVKLLSQIRGAFFFISTHILEVAEDLSISDNIDFKCFESVLNTDKLRYDYKLKEGVTTGRVGMQIIKNEGIEEILSEIIRKQN